MEQKLQEQIQRIFKDVTECVEFNECGSKLRFEALHTDGKWVDLHIYPKESSGVFRLHLKAILEIFDGSLFHAEISLTLNDPYVRLAGQRNGQLFQITVHQKESGFLCEGTNGSASRYLRGEQ